MKMTKADLLLENVKLKKRLLRFRTRSRMQLQTIRQLEKEQERLQSRFDLMNLRNGTLITSKAIWRLRNGELTMHAPDSPQ